MKLNSSLPYPLLHHSANQISDFHNECELDFANQINLFINFQHQVYLLHKERQFEMITSVMSNMMVKEHLCPTLLIYSRVPGL